jgi:hypothetical protein
MAIHDYIISNQTFPATRTDINNVLEAIVSKNSSGTAPATTYAYMWWYDTATTTLKIRNRDDDAWISFASFDQDNDTVNFLDSEVSIAGVTTSATGTVLTLTDSTVTSSVDFIIDNQKEIRFREQTGNGTNYVALKAPASVASDLTFTLPATDGASGQALVTNGSGVLSFASAGLAWQSVQTTGFTAVKGNAYPCDTSSAGFTVTLPATPSAGDQVQLVDYAGTFDSNALTINPNGEDIEGSGGNFKLTGEREGVILTYIDSTQGWIATSGINEGTDALEPVTYAVDFLVIAGGGGSGAGGSLGGAGGAGGYRSSNATYGNSGGGASAESSLTFTSGTVYTITVGAGGAGGGGGASIGNSGSNSSISGTGITTITSTGGGGGGGPSGTVNGLSGGSGGGGSGQSTASASGTANQGYAGGFADNAGYASSGGGGAGQVGGNASGPSSSAAIAGNGGNGVASTITGSSVTRGGGGGGTDYIGGSFGTGGTGGGGRGGSTFDAGDAENGTANTGGGGGGQENNSTRTGGGKGVVILRMPDANYSGTTTGSPTVTQNVGGTDTVIVFNDSGSYTG